MGGGISYVRTPHTEVFVVLSFPEWLGLAFFLVVFFKPPSVLCVFIKSRLTVYTPRVFFSSLGDCIQTYTVGGGRCLHHCKLVDGGRYLHHCYWGTLLLADDGRCLHHCYWLTMDDTFTTVTGGRWTMPSPMYVLVDGGQCCHW